MIDFACKKFDLKEVIRCNLNFTKTEFKIGLSTSQKAINEINKKELIKRNQRNLKKGGYIFIYSIKENPILKQKILEIIHNWMKEVEVEIQKW